MLTKWMNVSIPIGYLVDYAVLAIRDLLRGEVSIPIGYLVDLLVFFPANYQAGEVSIPIGYLVDELYTRPSPCDLQCFHSHWVSRRRIHRRSQSTLENPFPFPLGISSTATGDEAGHRETVSIPIGYLVDEDKGL